jgi:hypothetical protein
MGVKVDEEFFARIILNFNEMFFDHRTKSCHE